LAEISEKMQFVED